MDMGPTQQYDLSSMKFDIDQYFTRNGYNWIAGPEQETPYQSGYNKHYTVYENQNGSAKPWFNKMYVEANTLTATGYVEGQMYLYNFDYDKQTPTVIVNKTSLLQFLTANFDTIEEQTRIKQEEERIQQQRLLDSVPEIIRVAIQDSQLHSLIDGILHQILATNPAVFKLAQFKDIFSDALQTNVYRRVNSIDMVTFHAKTADNLWSAIDRLSNIMDSHMTQ